MCRVNNSIFSLELSIRSYIGYLKACYGTVNNNKIQFAVTQVGDVMN